MPILLKPSRPSLPNEMLATFVMSFLSLSLLFVALLRARYRLATLVDSLAVEEAAESSTMTTLRAEPIR
jgi:hypothetical protein